MSGNVDERIVRLSFDNRQFEKDVSVSMSTIDKLKKSLKLEEAAKGFNEIDKAAKSVDFSALMGGIQEVHNKFSFLDVMTLQIFERISNAAINLGKKIADALVIEPVTTGFQEYETKMNSIQVIAANTGALNNDVMESAARSANDMADSLQAAMDIWNKGLYGNGQARVDALTAAGFDASEVQGIVNQIASGVEVSMEDLEEAVGDSSGTTISHIEDVLDDLNLYADKTIYNFTQMTSAIGQFTTAGIDVDTSATSVKGIANLAAYVGAPASDASRSMFQLSQALATGRVRLQDWMSLEHTAGMGGKVFQDALVETSKHLQQVNADYNEMLGGFSAEDFIDAEGSFRESLRDNWLTSDVLNETLAKFSGSFDKEYWANLGYNDEEIADIMQLGKVATDAATKVRTFTQMWEALKEAAQSGWTESWQYIIGGFEQAPILWTAINNAITSVIDPINNARNAVLKFWSEEGGRSAWFDTFTETTYALDEFGHKIVKLDENGEKLRNEAGAYVYEMEEITRYSGILANVWETLGQIIEPIQAALHDVFPEDLGPILVELSQKLEDFTLEVLLADKPLDQIYRTFKGLFSIVRIGLIVFGGVAKIIGHLVKVLFPPLAGGLLDTTAAIGDVLSAASTIETVINWVDSAVETSIGVIDDFANTINNLVNSILDWIAATTGIDLRNLFTIEGLTNAFNVIKGFFLSSISWFEQVTGLDLSNLFTLDNLAKVLGGIKTALELLFGVVFWAITSIDFKGIIANVTGFFQTVVGWIEKTTGLKIGEIIPNLIGQLKGLWTTLTGIKSVEDLLGLLTKVKDTFKGFYDTIVEKATKIKDAITGLFSGDDKKKKDSGNLVDKLKNIGTAVKNFFDNLTTEDVGKIVGITIAIGSVVEIIKAFRDIASVFSTLASIKKGVVDVIEGVGDAVGAVKKSIQVNTMLKLAIAIGIVVAAIIALAFLPEEQLEKALATLTIVFTGLTAMLQTLLKLVTRNDPKAISGVGFAFLGMAIAIGVMTSAVMILGLLPADKVGQGLFVVALMMALIGGFMKAMKDFKSEDIVKGAFAVAIVVGAIWLMIPPMLLFSAMPLKNIVKGGLVVVVIMGVLLGMMAAMEGISKIGGSGKNMIAAAASMILIAAAINLLAGIVIALGFVPADKVWQGFGVTMLMATILTALTIAFSLVKGGSIKKILTTVLMMSVIVGTIWSFAALVIMLGAMDAEKLKQGLNAFKTIAIAMGALMVLVLAISIVSALGGGAASPLGAFTKTLLAMVAALLMIAAAIWLFVDAGEKFYNLLVLIGKNGKDAIINGVQAVIDAIPIIGALIATHIPKLVKSLMLGFIRSFTMIVAYLPALFLLFDVFIFEILNHIAVISREIVALLLHIISEIIYGLAAGVGELMDALVVLVVAVIDGLGIALQEHAEELVIALLNLLIGVGEVFRQLFEAIWGILVEMWNRWKESAAYQWLEGLGEWIYDKVQAIKDFFDGVKDTLNKMVMTVILFVMKIILKVKMFFMQLKLTTKMKMHEIHTFIDEKIHGILDTVLGIVDGFKQAGQNIIDGLLGGISDAWEKGKDFVTGIADGIVNVFTGKDGIDAHSPSRRFMKIGAFIPQGLAIGVMNAAGIANKSMRSLSDGVITSFGNPMKSIAEIVDSDMDFEPTISPVIDMSNVAPGISRINHMFSSRTLGLADVNGTLNVEARKIRDQQNQNRTYNDKKIVNNIEALHRSITKMNDNLANQQIVMDTGALVGATVGPMDTALGRRMQRTKRGG